ncbi:MAG: hypothetical protein ACPGPS_21945, partial [Rubripirellula sp.]
MNKAHLLSHKPHLFTRAEPRSTETHKEMTDGPMNAMPVDRYPFSARGTFFPSLTGRPPSGTIHPVQLQQNADCVRFRFPPEQDSGVPQPALTLATTDVPIRCRRIQRGITQFAKFRRD